VARVPATHGATAEGGVSASEWLVYGFGVLGGIPIGALLLAVLLHATERRE
jgi:hypothetical protein